jgi:hypothetical protein
MDFDSLYNFLFNTYATKEMAIFAMISVAVGFMAFVYIYDKIEKNNSKKKG